MKFHKYQALRNDYIVVEFDAAQTPSPALVRRICDRHYGLGSDGILMPGHAPNGDHALRIFNPDGSEAEKSGNGIRIFARYLWDMKRVSDQPFRLITKGGVVQCQVQDHGRQIMVDMGKVTFDSAEIPIAGPQREVIDEELDVAGEKIRFNGASIGNPHYVIHADATSRAMVERLGPLIERHEKFPNRTNVQFVKIASRRRIEIEIWERGAGYTFASGSSSCAAAAASVRRGFCDPDLVVAMPGGELSISVSTAFEVRMTGPAAKVAEGVLSPELIRAAA
ncbi:diaminopimelate epimerase [Solimonas sp. SE-A11]|uniref:diaminopimelate epimerase n=1 Tax=Solimonas sp. SE-A11 TaxID=3054954 RepID=UPI00259CE8CA|nr:diaminopimelate epimerase [Solimonas sp. SE-A11]MDM4768966.1 diaminopimelate epimerase [Solimonas sp. SE-A11]